jgi:hypothetical protein
LFFNSYFAEDNDIVHTNAQVSCDGSPIAMVSNVNNKCIKTSATSSTKFTYPNQYIFTDSSTCTGPSHGKLYYPESCTEMMTNDDIFNGSHTVHASSYLENPSFSGSISGYLYLQYYNDVNCAGEKTATSGLTAGTCLPAGSSMGSGSYQVIINDQFCVSVSLLTYSDDFCQNFVGTAPLPVDDSCMDDTAGTFYSSSKLVCSNSTVPPIDVPSVLST